MMGFDDYSPLGYPLAALVKVKTESPSFIDTGAGAYRVGSRSLCREQLFFGLSVVQRYKTCCLESGDGGDWGRKVR